MHVYYHILLIYKEDVFVYGFVALNKYIINRTSNEIQALLHQKSCLLLTLLNEKINLINLFHSFILTFFFVKTC